MSGPTARTLGDGLEAIEKAAPGITITGARYPDALGRMTGL